MTPFYVVKKVVTAIHTTSPYWDTSFYAEVEAMTPSGISREADEAKRERRGSIYVGHGFRDDIHDLPPPKTRTGIRSRLPCMSLPSG
jgi:hypothetical protein